MSNVVFIFGAGASYDVRDRSRSGDERWCPPLSDDLFDARFDSIFKKYRRLSGIVSDLSNNTEDFSLEDYLQDVMFMRSKKQKSRLLQLYEVQFYLRELLARCSKDYIPSGNVYATFLQMLVDAESSSQESHSFTLISFNYDTFLDRALEEQLNYQFNSINSYIDNPIKLIKLHGSCDWRIPLPVDNHLVRRVREEFGIDDHNDDPAPFLMHLKGEFQTRFDESKIEIEDYNPTTKKSVLDAPVIAMPLREKTKYFCPIIHIAHMQNSLKNADYIVIIGWKGRDKGFGGELKSAFSDEGSKCPKLVIVGGRDIEKVKATTLSYFTPKDTQLFREGFHDFVHNCDYERFTELFLQ